MPPGESDRPAAALPGQVDLRLTDPERQARWTVLLRAILVLPNYLVLVALLLVSFPVVVVNWFGALVLGRSPEPLWRFLRGVLRWQARFDAYVYLLTARYPPFSTRDEPYPVAMVLEGPPQRVRRWAVLFRVVVALPAYVLCVAYGTGAGLLAIVAWACGLLLGRVPRSLHLILATALRYQLRLSAYLAVLTPRYPAGLLGDARSAAGGLAQGTIVLGPVAKGVSVAVLVVGLLFTFGDGALSTALAVRSPRARATAEWSSIARRAATASSRFQSRAAGCNSNLPCVEHAMTILRADLSTQITGIDSIDFPTAGSRRDASVLVGLLRRERSAVDQLMHAPSAAAFQTDAATLRALTARVAQVAVRLADELSGQPPPVQ